MRYENCQYCGKLLINQANFLVQQGWKDVEFIFDMGYCDILHRKSHERQLIKEGKIEGIQSTGFAVMKDSKYRDSRGERIWFPNDERPYFDKALQRTFYSKKEKAEFLKKNNLAMDGSMSNPNLRNIPEAGDARWQKVK